MVRVSVHPIDGSIARAFIERLLMFDVTLCLDEEAAQEIQERHATLLQAGIAKVIVSNEVDVSFDFFSLQNTILVNQIHVPSSCMMSFHLGRILVLLTKNLKQYGAPLNKATNPMHRITGLQNRMWSML